MVYKTMDDVKAVTVEVDVNVKLVQCITLGGADVFLLDDGGKL